MKRLFIVVLDSLVETISITTSLLVLWQWYGKLGEAIRLGRATVRDFDIPDHKWRIKICHEWVLQVIFVKSGMCLAELANLCTVIFIFHLFRSLVADLLKRSRNARCSHTGSEVSSSEAFERLSPYIAAEELQYVFRFKGGNVTFLGCVFKAMRFLLPLAFGMTWAKKPPTTLTLSSSSNRTLRSNYQKVLAFRQIKAESSPISPVTRGSWSYKVSVP